MEASGPDKNEKFDRNSDNFTLNSKLKDASEVVSRGPTQSKFGFVAKMSKVKLLTMFDHKRMQFFLELVQNVNQAKNVADALLPVLHGIKEIVNSASCSFFLF